MMAPLVVDGNPGWYWIHWAPGVPRPADGGPELAWQPADQSDEDRQRTLMLSGGLPESVGAFMEEIALTVQLMHDPVYNPTGQPQGEDRVRGAHLCNDPFTPYQRAALRDVRCSILNVCYNCEQKDCKSRKCQNKSRRPRFYASSFWRVLAGDTMSIRDENHPYHWVLREKERQPQDGADAADPQDHHALMEGACEDLFSTMGGFSQVWCVWCMVHGKTAAPSFGSLTVRVVAHGTSLLVMHR